MKKVRVTLSLALLIALVTPVAAQAQATVMGGPYTNLKPTGQIIHLALSNFPTSSGLYIMQCLQSTTANRPAICNQAAQLWISNSPGASFIPTADIQFKPTAQFTSGATSVDCATSSCIMFIRLDHTAPSDLSEDQSVPLAFSGVATTPALPADVVTATINGKELSAAAPLAVNYRDILTVVATSKVGAPLTYASLAPACSIKNNEVTVLKGVGYCDIAVTSAGNTQAAGMTAHFPLKLNLGKQSVQLATSGSVGSKISLPATTNFGEKILYKVAGKANCNLNGETLFLKKKGACVLKSTAAEFSESYGALNQTSTIKVK